MKRDEIDSKINLQTNNSNNINFIYSQFPEPGKRRQIKTNICERMILSTLSISEELLKAANWLLSIGFKQNHSRFGKILCKHVL